MLKKYNMTSKLPISLSVINDSASHRTIDLFGSGHNMIDTIVACETVGVTYGFVMNDLLKNTYYINNIYTEFYSLKPKVRPEKLIRKTKAWHTTFKDIKGHQEIKPFSIQAYFPKQQVSREIVEIKEKFAISAERGLTIVVPPFTKLIMSFYEDAYKNLYTINHPFAYTIAQQCDDLYSLLLKRSELNQSASLRLLKKPVTPALALMEANMAMSGVNNMISHIHDISCDLYRNMVDISQEVLFITSVVQKEIATTEKLLSQKKKKSTRKKITFKKS